jgi:hypothetical protein
MSSVVASVSASSSPHPVGVSEQSRDRHSLCSYPESLEPDVAPPARDIDSIIIEEFRAWQLRLFHRLGIRRLLHQSDLSLRSDTDTI